MSHHRTLLLAALVAPPRGGGLLRGFALLRRHHRLVLRPQLLRVPLQLRRRRRDVPAFFKSTRRLRGSLRRGRGFELFLERAFLSLDRRESPRVLALDPQRLHRLHTRRLALVSLSLTLLSRGFSLRFLLLRPRELLLAPAFDLRLRPRPPRLHVLQFLIPEQHLAEDHRATRSLDVRVHDGGAEVLVVRPHVLDVAELGIKVVNLNPEIALVVSFEVRDRLGRYLEEHGAHGVVHGLRDLSRGVLRVRSREFCIHRDGAGRRSRRKRRRRSVVVSVRALAHVLIPASVVAVIVAVVVRVAASIG
mmetsp:Transcript_7024/g.31740  ORF Transcript_7024/g.31740 Transcript_7024/m.31740 type:complete len:305 (+) Transcript_7024:1001-1915(+)